MPSPMTPADKLIRGLTFAVPVAAFLWFALGVVVWWF